METPTRSRNEKKWLTAYLCSRTLAQYSTDRYAGGLYCRVRNGTGCDPAAMAVIPRPAMHIRYIMFFDSGLKSFLGVVLIASMFVKSGMVRLICQHMLYSDNVFSCTWMGNKPLRRVQLPHHRVRNMQHISCHRIQTVDGR